MFSFLEKKERKKERKQSHTSKGSMLAFVKNCNLPRYDSVRDITAESIINWLHDKPISE